MLKNLWLDLQLFADGGDGGDGGGTAPAGEANETGEDVPAFIPEKARETYKKAMAKTGAKSTQQPQEVQQAGETSHVPYADLIKSDEYKDEHKAYMDKTIGDRLKKYKDLEPQYKAARSIVDIVGAKYGLDPASETYMQDLAQKVQEDDSYYENYAMEHDMTPAQARQLVSMQRKVEAAQAEERQREEQEQVQRRIRIIQENAAITASKFPGFDLQREMQDERFGRLVAATNGDTTAAYMALHGDEIMHRTAQAAATQAQTQTAQAVAANKARPIEAGLSGNAASTAALDFKHMNLQQIRAYAEEQRRKSRR